MPNLLHPTHWIRAIFFDAAGTLFQLAEPVGHTYARIAAHHGIRAEPDRLESSFRAAWRELPLPLHPEGCPPPDDDRSWWREIVRTTFAHGTDQPIPDSRGDALFADLYQHYGKAAAWRLHDDTAEALRELARHFRLLVLSNFDRRLHLILEGLGIASGFERVIVSSEVGASKPHPRMFQAAVSACGLTAGECLHVGDDARADVAGAREAGLPCFQIDRPKVTLATLVEKIAANDFRTCIGGIPD